MSGELENYLVWGKKSTHLVSEVLWVKTVQTLLAHFKGFQVVTYFIKNLIWLNGPSGRTCPSVHSIKSVCKTLQTWLIHSSNVTSFCTEALPDHPTWHNTHASLSLHSFIFILTPIITIIKYLLICCLSPQIKCKVQEGRDFVLNTTFPLVLRTMSGTQYSASICEWKDFHY